MKQIDPINFMIDLTIKNECDIDEHLMTLFALTLSMKPSVIIELGVRTARSSLPFLLGCQYTGAKLYSVDINNPVPDFTFPESWTECWSFIKKDAVSFLKDDFPNLWNDSGNIIYIDDWHAADHVAQELSLISDYVSPNDLILLHDLMYGNSQPSYRSVESPSDKQWDGGGPYRAVSELNLEEWEYSTVPRCHGLTLLRKKSKCVIDA